MKKRRSGRPEKPVEKAVRSRVEAAEACPVCGARGEPFSCKLICPRCRIVLVNCSDS